MMAQYFSIKRNHPDCILFFRMGDFYEMFFEDAVMASGVLGITLTQRGKHLSEDIPMCGVPVHSHEVYLARLIRRGLRVAICEQTEPPKTGAVRSGRALLNREVVRVITPGTVLEDSLLDARRQNYLAAVAADLDCFGLAWLDISTGEFLTQALGPDDWLDAIDRLDAREILIPDKLLDRLQGDERTRLLRSSVFVLPSSRFDSSNARSRLEARLGVRTLDSFGAFSSGEVTAAGALIDYVDLTLPGSLATVSPPRPVRSSGFMEIDAATRRSLELCRTLAGEDQGSLLATIDRTITGPGARALLSRLLMPLTDVPAINDRLDAVQFFMERETEREEIRSILRGFPDIERCLSRLIAGRASPRDLSGIRDGLCVGSRAVAVLGRPDLDPLPAALAAALEGLEGDGPLQEELARSLIEAPPPTSREGGFIAAGYSAALDDCRRMRDDGRQMIAGLQARYVEKTGIGALKIRHNQLVGYSIEIPNRMRDRLDGPGATEFIHRQTLSNVARYTSIELTELEHRLARAGDESRVLEQELFNILRDRVLQARDKIATLAQCVANLDVAAAFAALAVEEAYCRPVVDTSLDLEIWSGRHPVVDIATKKTKGIPFVANDCNLQDDRRIWLLTAPNMAGKSTFLRQNALITILAQIGSYVPAESARVGIVDRVFSRIGAADDLAQGRSTFMVEMVETATILRQAGRRSLVILDELGRGTATFDGLSIAWAVVEYLHDVIGCRTLFATHYHELTALAAKLSTLACYTMRVKEWKGDIAFLHEVIPGATSRSYGIHVGRLAGLPVDVVVRAEDVLRRLDKDKHASALARLADELPLFAVALNRPLRRDPSPAEALLASLDPDHLTPRQSLDLIYKLKGMI
jgi:DNA mismatch repair protein MutS